MTDPRRSLPKVDALVALLSAAEGAGLTPEVLAWVARRTIADARSRLETGGSVDVESEARELAAMLTGSRMSVINATGVLLHTNLGRASLHPLAIQAGLRASGSYPVEMELDTGARGGRGARAGALAASLAGAEAGLAVNNNASALVLAATALAGRREIIVGRGELITIGGSFRLPEMIGSAGAFLREVGTTNKTTSDDFRQAIGDRTAMILSAHPSNFTVEGFTAGPSITDLAGVAEQAAVPLMYDIGSGLLEPHDLLPDEPDARSAVAAGADLVCFSGDKLLGGPQAGVIIGRADLVRVLAKHPLFRALRPGKVALAQLEETLAIHARGQRRQLPVWSMIERPASDLAALAKHVVAESGAGAVVECRSLIGGGSAPGVELPSWGAVLDGDPAAVGAALRRGSPGVIGRTEAGRTLLDMRSVDPQSIDALVEVLKRIGIS